jgi:hypothetical protein
MLARQLPARLTAGDGYSQGQSSRRHEDAAKLQFLTARLPATMGHLPSSDSQVIRVARAPLANVRTCRIAGVARPHTYSLACMSITVAAIVNSSCPSDRGAALNADSVRLCGHMRPRRFGYRSAGSVASIRAGLVVVIVVGGGRRIAFSPPSAVGGFTGWPGWLLGLVWAGVIWCPGLPGR